ncbi:MAG: hypothetical protein KAI99_10100 [Cyclobacteriaceae bacterium]|nr:hypothetical protein [Cyclobacteriaceae bacterium]
MTEKNKDLEYNFTKPAIYKIVVQGKIDDKLSDRMLDLQVNVEKGGGQKYHSTLIGKINDQAALSGILNTLYDMHITVISVNMLSEIEDIM